MSTAALFCLNFHTEVELLAFVAVNLFQTRPHSTRCKSGIQIECLYGQRLKFLSLMAKAVHLRGLMRYIVTYSKVPCLNLGFGPHE
jgi:hypothetical protein